MRPLTLVGEDVEALDGLPMGGKLRVIHRHGVTFSAWEPSPEELKSLINGNPVWLCISGRAVPIVTMIAGHRTDILPPPDAGWKTAKAQLHLGEDKVPIPAIPVKAMIDQREHAYWLWVADRFLRWTGRAIVAAIILYLGYRLGHR
jgi:hypothetical protein